MFSRLKNHLKEVLGSVDFVEKQDLKLVTAAVDRLRDDLARQNDHQNGLGASAYIDTLAGPARNYRDPRCISAAPGQVYSQNNEDGILAEIFRRIGCESKTFVEIAAGDGIENTTRLLLETGWRGLWVEGGDAEADCIRNLLRTPLADGRLAFANEMVTVDNVQQMVEASGFTNPDYISVDIDYNTSHVWRQLMKFRPRVFCIEFNAHFPPSMAYEVPYSEDKVWIGTNRFGASLKALEIIGAENDYRLVGCDIFGVNAFFVRADLCNEDLFWAPFTAEHHYEPPRFSAVRMRGHGRHLNFAQEE